MMIASYLRRKVQWGALLLTISVTAALIWVPANAIRPVGSESANSKSLSAKDFSRLVQDFSEEGGYFRSDNFTSNETSYLHIVGKMREMGVSGGAYIGVGPEQNFTYIAKIRPQIAFIVDIRRQAALQHLLYKALFHMSKSRAEFLSNLLSRPLSKDVAQGKEASVVPVVEYLSSAAALQKVFQSNLAKIKKIIIEDFQIPLSEDDKMQLEHVYSAFYRMGIDISYRIGGMNWARGFGRFPSLRDLILQTDQNGKMGNFLSNDDDYQFVRELHRKNRIIPIVGDFAGGKALASVGDYLRKNGYAVSAFYTSNVEQYLFQYGVFNAFAENVRKLPIDSNSLFIRAVPMTRHGHPAQVAGHPITTLLQKMSVFMEDFDEGLYTDYWMLTTTHFIAGE